MISDIRKAKAAFYEATGLIPRHISIRPQAFFTVVCEVTDGSISVDFETSESVICGMIVEQVPDLKTDFEVYA